ncbi:translation initiation factor IF-2-like [Lutra lutra]|uniref:translation initiation factor IF-2-like n=1 Tax=Lutra lutra TaxID=9657 RepID=UPI001FD3D853|nr:translation initiation factor IF-2-like [Lutra lutra]
MQGLRRGRPAPPLGPPRPAPPSPGKGHVALLAGRPGPGAPASVGWEAGPGEGTGVGLKEAPRSGEGAPGLGSRRGRQRLSERFAAPRSPGRPQREGLGSARVWPRGTREPGRGTPRSVLGTPGLQLLEHGRAPRAGGGCETRWRGVRGRQVQRKPRPCEEAMCRALQPELHLTVLTSTCRHVPE